jgi:hypothetical protein
VFCSQSKKEKEMVKTRQVGDEIHEVKFNECKTNGELADIFHGIMRKNQVPKYIPYEDLDGGEGFESIMEYGRGIIP